MKNNLLIAVQAFHYMEFLCVKNVIIEGNLKR